MASIVNYVADGATNQFQIPFTYINQTDVVVTVNGTTPTFTFVNTTTINIASTPTSGAKVIIKRVTPLNALVDFTDGSTLFEADLDLAHKQNRLIAEESRDRADSAIDTIDANITNIDTVAGIAANVTTVAGNTTNVNSVATNMAEVLLADTNAATATTKASQASASASTASAQATISTTKAGQSSTSASEALASKNAASSSQSASATSETNAANSATASANSASASSSSASSSSSSQTVATTKANEAVVSANNSATSATSSANSATLATTKASQAGTSQSASAVSETNALSSKNAAATSATNAETSKNNAATSATASANSSSTSTTKANEAASSATAAANSATASANSATAGANSATAAANSASSITGAETNAANSASAASASKDAALAALDSFDDRYLGTKSSNPSVDNDGNSLVAGTLYFNSTDDVMKVYEGSTWVAAFASLSGIDVPATNLTGTIAAARLSTATTQAESDDSTKIATTAYVVDKITTLIGGAPSTLNDLNELAAAINDDASYNSTLTTALATKLPKAGGTMTGNLTLGDNNKAIFGAGSDLQIYHDGSHSIIEDAGVGALKVKVGDFRIENASGNNLIKAVGDVASLHHAGAVKLTTASGGIAVTGTATVGNSSISSNSSHLANLTINNNGNIGSAHNTSAIQIVTGGDVNFSQKVIAKSSSSGDYVRMYGGSGTGKWDIYGNGANLRIGDNESAGHVQFDTNVGIGTSSPTGAGKILHLNGSGTVADFHMTNTTSGVAGTDGFIMRYSGLNAEFLNREAGANIFYTSSAERMRIDSSGNVGIIQDLNIGNNDSSNPVSKLRFGATQHGAADIRPSTSGHKVGLDFYTDGTGDNTINPTFAMRIDSSGKVLINTTSTIDAAPSAMFQVYNPTSVAGVFQTDNAGTQVIGAWNKGDAGTRYLMWFESNSARNSVGNISTNGTSTSYNTSSDYRLKENVVDLTGASARLNQLDVKRFNWITDDTNTLVDGFLAHEVATVVPEAVTGTKDAMKEEEYEVTAAVEEVTDDDGNVTTEAADAVMGTRNVPNYQSIDQSKLVPLLTAALQEALAKIDSMETRLTALEG